MRVPWGRIEPLAHTVTVKLLTGIPLMERLSRYAGPLPSTAKQVALLDLVRADLTIAEHKCGWNIANNPEVVRAIAGVVDAIVTLHNTLARCTVSGG